MMTTVILMAALCGQRPARAPERRDITHISMGVAAVGGLGTALIAEADRADRAEAETGRSRLIARRRAKYAARYTARTNREAAEAIAQQKAIEQARREYKEALPYMLEVRRQNLLRDGVHDLADAERAKAAAIGRAAGYATGAPPAPPRIVNLPGQPYAN